MLLLSLRLRTRLSIYQGYHCQEKEDIGVVKTRYQRRNLMDKMDKTASGPPRIKLMPKM
jgi:hypothetical protein